MGARGQTKSGRLRERIAQEAARIMIESGLRDFQAAKRKASNRLHVAESRELPGNQEIEEAINAYQRLFRSRTQPQRLRHLREEALHAMRFLDRFSPSLVGPVLHGTADQHSVICLHLFAEPAEEVGLFLMEHGIAHKQCDIPVKLAPDDVERLPAYRLFVNGETIELIVFSGRVRRRMPLSPIDGRPMQRARLGRVQALTESGP